MKMFRANYGTKIEELEIIRQTEKQIIYIDSFGREQGDYKTSQWQSWHETKKEAIEYLIEKRQKEIDSCLNKIRYLEEEKIKIGQL
jgi:hypothetical protein